MWQYVYNGAKGWNVFVDFFSPNTFSHLWLIYHMRFVLSNLRDFSCKVFIMTKILLQRPIENTCFSSSAMQCPLKPLVLKENQCFKASW
jgi:hypothetical protein